MTSNVIFCSIFFNFKSTQLWHIAVVLASLCAAIKGHPSTAWIQVFISFLGREGQAAELLFPSHSCFRGWRRSLWLPDGNSGKKLRPSVTSKNYSGIHQSRLDAWTFTFNVSIPYTSMYHKAPQTKCCWKKHNSWFQAYSWPPSWSPSISAVGSKGLVSCHSTFTLAAWRDCQQILLSYPQLRCPPTYLQVPVPDAYSHLPADSCKEVIVRKCMKMFRIYKGRVFQGDLGYLRWSNSLHPATKPLNHLRTRLERWGTQPVLLEIWM